MTSGSKHTKRSSNLSIDYKQLNELSSITLYDGVPKGKRGRLHEVERILTRRKIRHVSAKHHELNFSNEIYCFFILWSMAVVEL
jgi:hypothetical protein